MSPYEIQSLISSQTSLPTTLFLVHCTPATLVFLLFFKMPGVFLPTSLWTLHLPFPPLAFSSLRYLWGLLQCSIQVSILTASTSTFTLTYTSCYITPYPLALVLSLCIPFPHQICLFIYLFIVSLYLGNKYNKDRDIVAFPHFYMDPGTATWYVIILMFTHF